MMTLRQIASLAKELVKFLALFAGCFRSQPGWALAGSMSKVCCRVYTARTWKRSRYIPPVHFSPWNVTSPTTSANQFLTQLQCHK